METVLFLKKFLYLCISKDIFMATKKKDKQEINNIKNADFASDVLLKGQFPIIFHQDDEQLPNVHRV